MCKKKKIHLSNECLSCTEYSPFTLLNNRLFYPKYNIYIYIIVIRIQYCIITTRLNTQSENTNSCGTNWARCSWTCRSCCIDFQHLNWVSLCFLLKHIQLLEHHPSGQPESLNCTSTHTQYIRIALSRRLVLQRLWAGIGGFVGTSNALDVPFIISNTVDGYPTAVAFIETRHQRSEHQQRTL